VIVGRLCQTPSL